jgi:hypothetical protein
MMEEQELAMGECYGKFYEDSDPTCRKCFGASKCRIATIASIKQARTPSEEERVRQENYVLYLVASLDSRIGEYEAIRGKHSVLYRFWSDEKIVCNFVVSNSTRRLKVRTKKESNFIRDAISSRVDADNLMNELVQSVNENL